MELVHLFTFVVGVFSGVIGGISGAGGGLIISPYMILIGLPPSVAVSTPKLAGIGVGTGSLLSFRKSHKINWLWVKRLLPVTILAAILGAVLLEYIPENFIKIFALSITVFIALQFLTDKQMGLSRSVTSKKQQYFGYITYSVIETIRGAIGSGVGTINMMVLMRNFGLPAVEANATKRFVTYPALLIGLIILSWNGFVDWYHGVALLLGTGFGGFVGARIAIDQGNLFVRRFLVFTVFVLAISALFLG